MGLVICLFEISLSYEALTRYSRQLESSSRLVQVEVLKSVEIAPERSRGPSPQTMPDLRARVTGKLRVGRLLQILLQ